VKRAGGGEKEKRGGKKVSLTLASRLEIHHRAWKNPEGGERPPVPLGHSEIPKKMQKKVRQGDPLGHKKELGGGSGGVPRKQRPKVGGGGSKIPLQRKECRKKKDERKKGITNGNQNPSDQPGGTAHGEKGKAFERGLNGRNRPTGKPPLHGTFAPGRETPAFDQNLGEKEKKKREKCQKKREKSPAKRKGGFPTYREKRGVARRGNRGSEGKKKVWGTLGKKSTVEKGHKGRTLGTTGIGGPTNENVC